MGNKKVILMNLLMIIIALFLACGLTSCSGSVGFEFKEWANAYEISGYSGNSKNVTIPKTHNGKKVHAIDIGAFEGSSIEEITIPKTIVFIGGHAFKNSAVKTINFEEGSELDEISIFSLADAHNLQKINMPESVSKIGEGAFENCESLEEIVLSKNITQIGEEAFKGCNKLQKIVMPSSLTHVYEDAFVECTSLKDVYYNDLNSVFQVKFDNAEANPLYFASELYIDNKLANDLVITDPIPKTGANIFNNFKGIKSITFNNDSKITVPEEMFRGCTGLEKVDFSNKEVVLEGFSFFNCTNLANIKNCDNITCGQNIFGKTAWYNSQPNGLVYLDNILYEYKSDSWKNESLTQVEIKPNTKKIAYGAFKECVALEKVILPNSIEAIGNWAFHNCNKLVDITIPNFVEYIGEEAFSKCSSLEKINIPSSVKTIGAEAFNYCKKLNDVQYAGSVREWENMDIGFGWAGGIAKEYKNDWEWTYYTYDSEIQAREVQCNNGRVKITFFEVGPY